MAQVVKIAKVKANSARFVRPNIRSYNRLEGSPRTRDFERNISMETHDPMWFLCRQWQFGEFEGEDAGTAFQANVLGVHSQPEELRLRDQDAIKFNQQEPLEALVEREVLAPTLFLCAQMGRHFAKLLAHHRLKRYVSVFAKEFALDKSLQADDEEGQYLALALSDKIPDGYALFDLILKKEFKAFYQGHVDIENVDHAALAEVETEYFEWFVQLYYQPEEDESAWDPAHLEYRLSLTARHEVRGVRELVADQYASGHLDWRDFDQQINPTRRNLQDLPAASEHVQTFIPTPLRFSGMPHPRLWQLEDATINFGKVDGSPTSLLNVLLAQYGLNYSNDWFVLPYELPINTLCQIKGIMVKDVFGQHVLVRPAIEDPETDWQNFNLFHQSERDNATVGESIFYLSPSVGQLLESEDVERINFIRDEMSNMVWAIEQVVASGSGQGRQVKRAVPSLEEFTPAGDIAKIRYVLGNTVPNNWIPFMPVHKPVPAGQDPQEIRLQRARMPQGTGPVGKILNEEQPVYFIEEEEVSRSGIFVSRRFQRTRWLNGKTFLWMGRRKRTGVGEGVANLVFDTITSLQVDERT